MNRASQLYDLRPGKRFDHQRGTGPLIEERQTDCFRRRVLMSVAGLVSTLGALAAMKAAAAAPSGASAPGAGAQRAGACPAVLQHTFPRLQDESPVQLCDFAGKVVLVVNTASYCGFTPQYEGLERLHARYERRGLVILGFPSNDFGQQEPGTSAQIGELCFNTYGVKFPMFTKTVVVGPQAHPLYSQLARATGESPRWNFHKYLIDRAGKPVASYPSRVTPESREMVSAIEKALNN